VRRVVALALIAMPLVVGCGHGDPSAPLHVTWRESEGHPGCVYDAQTRTVAAKLIVTGDASGHHRLTATVTAYADENTSVPVGSTSRDVRVRGTMHRPVDLAIPVGRAPHIDEDGVAACRLEVTY
jgi:hypothetical protein